MEKINVDNVKNAASSMANAMTGDLTSTVDNLKEELGSSWKSNQSSKVQNCIEQIENDITAMISSLQNVQQSIANVATSAAEADTSAKIN